MAPVRSASLAIVLVLASAPGAMAQMVVGPPTGQNPGTFAPQAPVPGQGLGGFPGQGPGGPPGATQGALPGRPGAQAPPCMTEFAPLRTETEKRAAALKAAAAKRVPPQELCQLFTRFIESEAKVVKFMEKNAASCGIPAQIVSTTKSNHVKSGQTKEKVCSAAASGGSQATRGPALGDALGVREAPIADTTGPGAGTLDSLSGNPLKR